MRAAPAADCRGAALLVVIAVLTGAVACTAPGSSAEPAPTASVAQPATPSPAPPDSARPATDAPASVPAPPDAVLAVDGGPGIVGSLGSYTWGDAGSDAPWLPGAPASAPAGASLAVTVGIAPVESWDARYGASGGPDPGDIASLGSGGGAISFGAPPRGSWTVALDVRFGEGLGSASYYWRLEVE